MVMLVVIGTNSQEPHSVKWREKPLSLIAAWLQMLVTSSLPLSSETIVFLINSILFHTLNRKLIYVLICKFKCKSAEK